MANNRPLPLDRIDLFRIYARVVECSSFTRAANMLGLPRSSVSAAVQELEARIGARLLNRTTRRVAPTQDGVAFYETCTRLVADFDEAETLFKDTAARPSGRVRINVPSRVGRLIVAPALPQFLAAYPEIEIDLGMTDREINLIEENVDCVVRVGPLRASSLIARSIGELAIITVASPLYLQRHGIPATPDDLTQHLAVRYASPTTGRVEDWEWVQHGEARSVPVRGRVAVNSAEALIAAGLAGVGLIQIPAYDVRGHIEAGELVEVMQDFRAGPLAMTMLVPHRLYPSRRLKVSTGWLEDVLKRAIAG